MSTKTCKKCNVLQDIDNFYVHSKDGWVDNTCKTCRCEEQRARYENPSFKQRVKEYGKKYHQRPEVKAKEKQRRLDNPYRMWAHHTRNSHIYRGFEVLLSVDELEQTARNHSKCMLCGKQLSYDKHSKVNGDNPTVDRLNNENYLGKNNIFIVCHRCNTMKNSMTMQEFIDYCVMIGIKFGKRD